MIIINLKGGLGNQMFQYAFGRSLALDTGEPLVFHLAYFHKQHREQTSWPYELPQFNVNLTSSKSWWLGKLARVSRKPSSFASRALNPLFPMRSTVEDGLAYQAAARQITPHARNFFDGYWQSEKYFLHHRETLLQEFTPRQALGARSAALLHEIQRGNTVALHVRRGDYVTHAAANAVHGTCDLAYYRSALAFLEAQLDSPRFCVFSDDIAWAQQHLQAASPIIFADYSVPVPPHEDLFLISRCQHQVIANSSFSWWGAWLNPNPDKIVIAPRRWFRDETRDTADLVPQHWVRL